MIVAAIAVFGLAVAGFGAGAAHAPAPASRRPCSGSRWSLAGLFLALAGGSDSVSSVFRQTILQSATPDDMRGRLQGIFIVVVAGGPRLGDLVLGTGGHLDGGELGRARRRAALRRARRRGRLHPARVLGLRRPSPATVTESRERWMR